MSRAAYALLLVATLAGCAVPVAQVEQPPATPFTRPAPAPMAQQPADDCRAEVDRLNARLAAERAERLKIARAASYREEELRRQLEAMKSIERGILDRDEGKRTETR
jgi:hypothetical protein